MSRQSMRTATTFESAPDRVIRLWEKDDPRALVNLVGPDFEQRLLTAKAKEPDLFEMDEPTLLKELKGRGQYPTSTDHYFKMRFWMEYDDAQVKKCKINLSRTVQGVMDMAFFYGKYSYRPHLMAFLVCPPMTYSIMMEEGLCSGLRRIQEILSVSPINEAGLIDKKIADLQIKVYALLDARINGAFTQRIEQKNLNVNVGATQENLDNMTMDELNAKLKLLEAKDRDSERIKARSRPPEDIEVESKKL